MPSAIKVRLEGAKELKAKLDNIELKVRKKILRRAVRESARPIQQRAAELAPRRKSDPPRTGGKPLHRNIVIRSAGRQAGFDFAVHVGPGRTAWYGLFQELGTRHHPAQPFLRPAFDQMEGTSVQVMRKVLGEAIEREASQ